MEAVSTLRESRVTSFIDLSQETVIRTLDDFGPFNVSRWRVSIGVLTRD